jgi:ketosteroid isomerase-like protein
MDDVRAQRWLDDYVAAWRNGDRDRIGELFSEQVSYRYHPYDHPVLGREAVVQSWLEDANPSEEWEAEYRIYAVDGQRAVATGTTRYLATDDHPERFYYNVFLVEFDDEGRCAAFTEYFVKRP